MFIAKFCFKSSLKKLVAWLLKYYAWSLSGCNFQEGRKEKKEEEKDEKEKKEKEERELFFKVMLQSII